MAQFYTSFDDSPSLTEEWHTTDGAFSIETSGLPTGASDGAALQITLSVDQRYAVSWDAVGTPTGDVEFLMRWQVDATVATANAGRAIICGGGGTTDEDAYLVSHLVTGFAGDQTLIEYDAAGVSTLGTNSQLLSANTWYWTRIEKTGTTIRYRTWADADAEPGTWDVSVTDATHSGGWVGPGHSENGQVLWVDKMGAGTGGDAAPDAPVGVAIPIVMHYRKMAGAN